MSRIPCGLIYFVLYLVCIISIKYLSLRSFLSVHIFYFQLSFILGKPVSTQQRFLLIPLFVLISEYIIKLILMTFADVDVAISLHLANS